MKKILPIIIISSFLLLVATPVFAFPSLVPAGCRGAAYVSSDDATAQGCAEKTPNDCLEICNLTQVQQIAINLAQIILGVAGSLALLMFVVGGVMFMISGGSQERVKKAVTILKSTVIGLAIIFLAGLAIQFILRKLTG